MGKKFQKTSGGAKFEKVVEYRNFSSTDERVARPSSPGAGQTPRGATPRHHTGVPPSDAPQGAGLFPAGAITGPLLDTPSRAQVEQQIRNLSKEEADLTAAHRSMRQALVSAQDTRPQDQPNEEPALVTNSRSGASSASSGGRSLQAQLSAMGQALGQELAGQLQRHLEAQREERHQELEAQREEWR